MPRDNVVKRLDLAIGICAQFKNPVSLIILEGVGMAQVLNPSINTKSNMLMQSQLENYSLGTDPRDS